MHRGTVAIAFAHLHGSSELAFLFIHPADEDVDRALESWAWIGLNNLYPVAVSAFGEVFLRASDQTIWHLDAIEGTLTQAADSPQEFSEKLLDAEYRDRFLLSGLVISARRRGLLLSEGECYDFSIAPILGGSIGPEHMQVMPFVAKMAVAGQLHRQAKGFS